MKHRSKVDLSFNYIPSHKTNVGRTIARVKREQAAAQAAQTAADQEAARKVHAIKKARGG